MRPTPLRPSTLSSMTTLRKRSWPHLSVNAQRSTISQVQLYATQGPFWDYTPIPFPLILALICPQAPARGPYPCMKARCSSWWRRTRATDGRECAGTTGTRATSRLLTPTSQLINDIFPFFAALYRTLALH